MRSWLFVPGHRQRMIDKALGLPVDAIILDLEDGVPLNEKESARRRIGSAVAGPRPGPSLFVRAHEAGHSALPSDLDAVLGPGLEGLVLPKVDSPKGVQEVAAELGKREAREGMQAGATRLVAMVESAQGLLQAPRIASSSQRLVGLMFGGEDFALDLGLLTAEQSQVPDLLYPRSALVVAAASRQLQAIDRICVSVREPSLLKEDSRQARQLGFSGKAVIHPNQIPIVHEVFTPNDREIAYARRVVEALQKVKPGDRGPVLVEGQMVDGPVAERAYRILEAWKEWESRGAPDD